jgi:hypothetical protein
MIFVNSCAPRKFASLMTTSELVQLKLNIVASDGDSTPPKVANLPHLSI